MRLACSCLCLGDWKRFDVFCFKHQIPFGHFIVVRNQLQLNDFEKKTGVVRLVRIL